MLIKNDYMESIIKKPWGEEYLIETNIRYTLKKLFMKQGEQCSLQFHKEKKETIYVLKGELIVHYKEGGTIRKTRLIPGESVTIEPNTIHRMEGETDVWYLEASTSELDDVVRLEDNYGRV